METDLHWFHFVWLGKEPKTSVRIEAKDQAQAWERFRGNMPKAPKGWRCWQCCDHCGMPHELHSECVP